MKSRFFIFIFVLVFNLGGFAQVVDPVKWTFAVNNLSNGEAELIYNAQISGDWHMYSMYFADGGPIKLSINYEQSDKYILVGKAIELIKPKTEHDEIFGIDVQYFAKEAKISQKIKVVSEANFSITGVLEYQVCIEEKCVMFSPRFSFSVKGFAKASKSVENNLNITTDAGSKKESEIDKSTQLPTLQINKISADTDSQTVKLDSHVNSDSINQIKSDNQKLISNDRETLKEKTQKMDISNHSFLYLFGMAFLAGMMAILTPCVFPMIPMTVTFFMHDKENKAKGRFQALVYGLSIILIYTVIGTIVAIVFGPAVANWLSTHWLPNILFFVIFMFFAASFLGMFEIILPSWIVNMSVSNEDRGGITGAFFMAFTLVLVSFSCTGPLVGSILVQSAGGKFIEPIIGMLGFSLAFALPFTLFAFFPSWLQNLPKSGGWLNSVKVVLGFVELALGLKFLSIADQTYHWGLLDREVYLAFWIIIFTLMGFYLLGKIKFAHDSEVKYLSVPRLMLVIITFTFVLYLIPGMFGAPLKALSGYLPPQSTHDFDLVSIVRQNAGNMSSSVADKNNVCEKPKYADFLHLPHGLEGYFDYEQGLACAKQLNKPVFIDFTGHGCVNCREMEARVWADDKVLRRLKEDFVIIALYVDDKTNLPEDEWVTNVEGRVLKTIGRKNADFMISRFGANAQPYYVLMTPDGQVLVEPRWYDLDIDEFVDFLDRGKDAFLKK